MRAGVLAAQAIIAIVVTLIITMLWSAWRINTRAECMHRGSEDCSSPTWVELQLQDYLASD